MASSRPGSAKRGYCPGGAEGQTRRFRCGGRLAAVPGAAPRRTQLPAGGGTTTRPGTGPSRARPSPLANALVQRPHQPGPRRRGGQAVGDEGSSLDQATRPFLERRFGHDFGRVRVHPHRRATQSGREISEQSSVRGPGTGLRDYHPAVRPGPAVTVTPRSLPVIQRFELPDSVKLGEEPANWRRSDRVGWTKRWQDACLHNLLKLNSHHYVKIEERRDFYKWFYEATAAKGYQTRWALAAYIVAGGMAEMAAVDWSEGASPITNEMQGLARIGNQVIFDDVLPKLKRLWENGPLKGAAALESDALVLAEEQNLIQAMYDTLSKDTMQRFQRIADNYYTRTQVGRGMGLGGSVDAGKYNVAGDVPDFSGKGGLVPGGDINVPEDRWRYGMALGAKFSSLPGYGIAGDMPEVGKDYTSGAEFNRLNVRPNLHMLDARLNDTDVPEGQVVSLLQKLNKLEQRELDSDSWRTDRLKNALSFSEMKQGIESLGNLPLYSKMDLLGGAESYDWNDIDYDDIQSIVKGAPLGQRQALHNDYWKGVFVKICTNSTIVTATIDLSLPPELAKEWIDAER